MSVAVVMDFPNATLEQYDRVIERMHLQKGGPGPQGALFHWATQTNGGIRVTDVWESRELFERFAHEQIGPYSREAGITDSPDISYYELHNYLTAGKPS
jgi:hypothetical protein